MTLPFDHLLTNQVRALPSYPSLTKREVLQCMQG